MTDEKTGDINIHLELGSGLQRFTEKPYHKIEHLDWSPTDRKPQHNH